MKTQSSRYKISGSSPDKKGPYASRAVKIAGENILPGERKRTQIEFASLYDYTSLSIPIEIIRGKKDGPTLFISAAIHGDEINGIEIIKRLMKRKVLNKLHGTLITIPIVNVFGFNNRSRYLPDRRDLNRCFPGRADGSLGAQIARVFMKEIVQGCSHGIDLHTGAIHRTNVPHIRAFLDNQETHIMAESFGTPVVIHANLRDGSLRAAAQKKKVKMLLFEGGEALRFNENVIRSGVHGCLSVMRRIGMLSPRSLRQHPPVKKVYTANQSYWIRANHSGAVRMHKAPGDVVNSGDILATISDPFGDECFEINATEPGIIIGMTTIPLVNRGDAMVHIANFRNSKTVRKAIEVFDELY